MPKSTKLEQLQHTARMITKETHTTVSATQDGHKPGYFLVKMRDSENSYFGTYAACDAYMLGLLDMYRLRQTSHLVPTEVM